MKRRRDIIDYANLALVAVLLAASVTLLLTFRGMANRLKDAEDRIAHSTSVIEVINDAAIGNERAIDYVTSSLQGPNGTLSGDIAASRDYLALTAAYTKAVRARATSADYAAVENAYRDMAGMQAFADTSDPWWRTRAYEGLAYAQMKLGRYTDAETNIKSAVESQPNSAFAGLTNIKLKCARRAASEEIGSEYRSLSDRLRRRVQETEPGSLERTDAELELGYIGDDQELFRMCQYAGLEREG